MQSTADYEVSFKAGRAWDPQFPGVVTVAVTPPVLEIYKKCFRGTNTDDPKASAQFRQALGIAVLANPAAFEYDCTDGAHRTKLGEEHFGPEVRKQVVVLYPCLTYVTTRLILQLATC